MKANIVSTRTVVFVLMAIAFMFALLKVVKMDTSALVWDMDTPEHLGMNQRKLEEARDYALTGGGSGCIIRGGRMVMSWGDQQQKYDLFSSTKSIGGVVLGLALMDGKVELTDKAVDYLSNFGVPPVTNRSLGWLENITLLQLATHTAGFEKTRAWGQLRFEPGKAWLYSDGGTNWLADILTVAYGMDLKDLMVERVFHPLDITVSENEHGDEDLSWSFNDQRPRNLDGIPRRPFNAGIRANVQAMAKIGYLHLRGGRWGEKQIIPKHYVDMVRAPAPGLVGLPVKGDERNRFEGAPDHYGILWWNNADGAIPGVPRNAYWAWGLKDSLIVVVPSLDLVIVRAGNKGWQDSRSGSVYETIKPFIQPVCESVAYGAPYPPGDVITSIAWAPKESIIRAASGSDNWPVTWADDRDLYGAWGDGWGFAEDSIETKLSLGFCKISGNPPNVIGTNIPSPDVQTGDGPKGKKASGMLAVDGVLYMWLRNVEYGTGRQSQLAWSADYAKNWTWSEWKFEELGYPCFLNFGKDYEGARDDYVYVYSPNTPSAYIETDEVVLARVPRNRVKERDAYEFFEKLDSDGSPSWTSDINKRGAVFRFPGGCNRMDVTYNGAIGRYLMVMRSRPKVWPEISLGERLSDNSPTRGVNQFSIYDAPEPWGPWTTVYYSEQWEGELLKDLEYYQGWGESAHIPSKWISSDGKKIQLLFSGNGLSIREAVLNLID